MSVAKGAVDEASAITLLKRAVELDNERRFTESLICYQEGLDLLIKVMRDTKDSQKKEHYQKRIFDYMQRAEKLKSHLKEISHENQHESIQIKDNATGYSYKKVFSRFLNEFLTCVEIDDAYIRTTHQITHFLNFCEMLINSEAKVSKILLKTGTDESSETQQNQFRRLNEITQNLKFYHIQLTVEYSKTLHDREIRFNNGWIIKIGRGLDYFKPVSNFSIGRYDMDLRPCHETSIDIFSSNS